MELGHQARRLIRMSEGQYCEFRALDRPLTSREMPTPPPGGWEWTEANPH